MNKTDIIQIIGAAALLVALIGLFVLAYTGKTDAAQLQNFILQTVGIVVAAALSWVAASKSKAEEVKAAKLEAQNAIMSNTISTLAEHGLVEK